MVPILITLCKALIILITTHEPPSMPSAMVYLQLLELLLAVLPLLGTLRMQVVVTLFCSLLCQALVERSCCGGVCPA